MQRTEALGRYGKPSVDVLTKLRNYIRKCRRLFFPPHWTEPMDCWWGKFHKSILVDQTVRLQPSSMSHHLLATAAAACLKNPYATVPPRVSPQPWTPPACWFFPVLFSLDTFSSLFFLFFPLWYPILIYLSFPVGRWATLFLEELQSLK